MLNKVRFFLTKHGSAASHSLNQVCRKPLSTMMVLLMLSLALTFPALSWVFTANLGRIAHEWRESGNIALYLKANSSEKSQLDLLTQIKALPGVAGARLISADEGMRLLSKQEGMADVLAYLPENPLPASIAITPAITVNTPELLNQLYVKLKAFPLVEQAKLDVDWVNKLYTILRVFSDIANSLMLFFSAAVVIIIANTLRLSLYDQHEEIRVMKLIGATEPYILRPFLYIGAWYGLFSSIIAILLVNIIIYGFGAAIGAILHDYQMTYPLSGMSLQQILLLVIFSIILGWLGARLSIKRQLSLIDPYA